MKSHTMISYVDKLLKVGLTLYVLWNAFNPLPALQERSIFLMWVLVCLFIHHMARSRTSKRQYVVDFTLIVVTIVSFGYVAIYHNDILFFAGSPPSFTIYLGMAAMVVLLIGCYRAIGWGLTLIIVASFLYGMFGHILPSNFGGHAYFSMERLIGSVYLSENGIFGEVTYTLLKYVFLFILFGKLLEKVGALSFIMDVVQSTMGKFRGGPAFVSCVSSGLVGSINGSAVANVMVTGPISIPLMKKVGFKSEFAGGVEAASSTGGQFLPPVMGATAFLIATFLGIQYIEVVWAALIPAVLYFVSILVAIYVYSIKHEIKAPPLRDLPNLKEALYNVDGLTFFTGFSVLIGLLTMGYSAIYSVLIASASLIIISFLSKKRLTVKKAVEVLNDTSEDFISIGVAGGAVGILVSMLLLTGLVLRFSGLMLGMVGENLVLILILTSLCAIVIGFGLPTVVTYIILSIMAVPILIDLGVTPIAAHLFVFFSGMVAMVTPPVALAALAASSIAKSDFWKTGFAAFKLALPALVLPFFFVYNEALLMIGSWDEILLATLFTTIGVCFMSGALTGKTRDGLEIIERVALLGAAVLLIVPNPYATVCGLILAGLALIRPIKKYVQIKKRKENVLEI